MAQSSFLRAYYKCSAVLGILGLVLAAAIAGWPALVGFGLGAALTVLVVWQWDMTLRLFLGPHKTSVALGSLLGLLQYGLPALLIYAIISSFVVSWPWALAGLATVLPSLMFAAFSSTDETGES